jgi:hypothetical protein
LPLGAFEEELQFIRLMPQYKFEDLATVPYNLYFAVMYKDARDREVELNLIEIDKKEQEQKQRK